MSSSGWVRELNRTQKAEAAFSNEHVTRERVNVLEAKMQGTMTRVDALVGHASRVEDVMARGLRGRLRWLFLGR